MNYPESARDALPKDESYPFGRETLDAALTTAGVEHVDLLYFLRAGIKDWRGSASRKVLRVDFRAATRDYRPRLEIRVHAVPAEQRCAVEAALVPDVVARAAEWIRKSETSDNVWRSSDHALVVQWEGDAVSTDAS
jgi:hypothetical protein